MNNLPVMKARQRIQDGKFDGLGYDHGQGIYNLYLQAFGSQELADSARAKHNARMVEIECERVNARNKQ